MDNMLQYIRWRGDLPVSAQAPLNPVDLLIFSQLAYAPMERLDGRTGELLSLRESVWPAVPRREDPGLALSRYELWAAMDERPRFARVRLALFSASFLPEADEQFAAALFLAGDRGIVAFRGTDATVVGWKEDFNLGLDAPVPGQVHAVRFLEQAAEQAALQGVRELCVCGHSKGGNLAMYASALCDPAVQERIVSVMSFDGPGLPQAVLTSEGWARIRPRLSSYIPESSVVGLLLGNVESTVVESDSLGLMQHNPFFWHVLGPAFVEAEGTTRSSQFMDQTLHSFLAQCPVEQRRVLIETLSRVMSASGAVRMRDVPRGIAAHFGEVMSLIQEIPPEQRRILLSVFRTLGESGESSLRSLLEAQQKKPGAEASDKD